MTAEITVHTMPLDALRARAREAQRLIAQAREIARASFEAPSFETASLSEGTDPSRRVGLLLDAVQRLLPGVQSLVEERGPISRSRARVKKPESGWRRVTLRGGTARALDTIERAQIVEDIVGETAGLIAEIERRSASSFRAADPHRGAVRATRG